MPQAVLDSPFGRMLQPQLEQMVQARKAQHGGLLGIQGNAAAKPAAPSVHSVGSLSELNGLLDAAKGSAAVVFFTSATCPPCKALYPLYDQLGAEWGHKVTLIKADTSRAPDAAQAHSIRATPTFVTFFHGEQQERWSGADATRLRSTVALLAQMAHPTHPHTSLRLPHFSTDPAAAPKPTIYAKVPPLAKLLSRLGDAAAGDAAVQGVRRFVETRAHDPVDAPLPDMQAFARFLCAAVADLPRDVLFAAVDLFRCALVDARFSGYFAEEPGHETVVTVLGAVNGTGGGDGEPCPYALRLVSLQMACNLFSSPLYLEQILGPRPDGAVLRDALTRLITSSFLDETHSHVRVAAASLLLNLTTAASTSTSAPPLALPEPDQVELAASVVEAISQETGSPEALRGMLLALGRLFHGAPLDGELADLLRALDARDAVLATRARFPDEGALIDEVGAELLGKGLARP